jgi:hypothetical protein
VDEVSALPRRFEEAGLAMEFASRPLGGSLAGDIFGMTIRKVRGKSHASEVFSVWPGHEKNRVAGLGFDRNLMQLVLLVHEPRRAFEQTLRKGARTTLTGSQNPSGEFVRSLPGNLEVRRFWTSDEKRHFLVGSDERNYFISQLPAGVSTVRDAHRVLKPATAAPATRRQGEWFFIPVSKVEEAWIQANKLLILRNTPISRGGNPHTCEEILFAPKRKLDFDVPATEGDIVVFMRGTVRHIDHKTVRFPEWMRVVRNDEKTRATGQLRGIAWVD